MTIDRRPIGHTDIEVSPVALGGWPITGITSLDVNEADNLATVRACLDHGINFVNTAYRYGANGESEMLIRRALGARRQPDPRWTAGDAQTGMRGKPQATRDGRAKSPMFQGEEYLKNLDVVDRLRELANEAGRTVAQVVINWTIQQAGITTAICGATRPDQVTDNSGAMGWQLTSLQLSQIDQALEERGDPVTVSPSPAMSARSDGTPGRVE